MILKNYPFTNIPWMNWLISINEAYASPDKIKKKSFFIWICPIKILSKMGDLKLVFLLLLVVASSTTFEDEHSHFLRRGLLNRLRHLEPPNRTSGSKSSQDQWFEQRLDHFNPMNVKTWQQRYFSRYKKVRSFMIDLIKQLF